MSTEKRYWFTGPIYDVFCRPLPNGEYEGRYHLIEPIIHRLKDSPPNVPRVLPTRVSDETRTAVRGALRVLSNNEHLDVKFCRWNATDLSEIVPIRLGLRGTDAMMRAAKTYYEYAFGPTSRVPRFGIDAILASTFDAIIGENPSAERLALCELLLDFPRVGLVVGANRSGGIVVLNGIW